MTPRERFEVALRDHGSSSAGGGLWRCPAHDDGKASLSVSDGKDGRALLHCFAECTPAAVVAALGLELADLFPREAVERSVQPRSPSKPPAPIEVLGAPTEHQVERLIRSRRITRAETLDLVGAKLARMWGAEWLAIPNLQGGWKLWAFGSNGEPRREEGKLARRNVGPVSLLASPDLHGDGAAGAPRLWDVEGESDALAAIDQGMRAVLCGTGGAASLAGHDLHREALRALAPAEVVVVRDLDAAGRAGGEKAAAWWLAQGVPARVLELPADLGEGGDVRDYLLGRIQRDASPAREPLGGPADLDALADAAPLRRPVDYAINAEDAETGPGGEPFRVNGVYRVPTEAAAWPAAPAPAAFHGLAGDFVRLVEPHTEADPAALLVQFLAMFGSAAGRARYFAVEADRHFPGLFVALVGETSKGRKGTSFSRAVSVFRAADPTWAEDRVMSGLSSGEGLIWAVRDPILKREPVRERGKVVDYQDVEADAGVADKRLLVVEAELASTLRVMGRDGNTLSPVIRQAWDSGNLRTLTKNSPAKATAAHVSLIGHIGRDELRTYLDRTEAGNGFGNRFLWVAVRRSKCLPDGGDLERVNFAPIARRLGEALQFARLAGELRRDAEAAEGWRSVYPTLSEGHPGLYGAVTSRAEAQVTRLALVYALLEGAGIIRLPHLEAALALWRYCADSAAYVFGDATGDTVADAIVRALRASPAGLTRNEIRDVFGRNRRSEEIERALHFLARLGRAHSIREETGGRPAERWRAGRPR